MTTTTLTDELAAAEGELAAAALAHASGEKGSRERLATARARRADAQLRLEESALADQERARLAALEERDQHKAEAERLKQAHADHLAEVQTAAATVELLVTLLLEARDAYASAWDGAEGVRAELQRLAGHLSSPQPWGGRFGREVRRVATMLTTLGGLQPLLAADQRAAGLVDEPLDIHILPAAIERLRDRLAQGRP